MLQSLGCFFHVAAATVAALWVLTLVLTLALLYLAVQFAFGSGRVVDPILILHVMVSGLLDRLSDFWHNILLIFRKF